MFLDPASEIQLQAGRILAGAAIAAFIAAPLFRRQAQTVRLIVTGVYIGSLLGYLFYIVIF